MWVFRDPRYALAWLASRFKMKQIGRIALFALALRHAGYLTLAMSPVTGPEIFYWTVYFYPALVVVWGIWKGHQVISWSVLWFLGLNIVALYAAARASPGFASPFSDEASFSLFVWGLGPFEAATFLILYAVWFWDRRLPAPKADGLQKPPPFVPQESRMVRFFLLGGTVLFLFLGLGLSLILYGANPALPAHEWRWPSWLTLTENRYTAFALFHVVSLTALASLLFFGVWQRRSDIIEAGCWLLVPGQIITVAWPPWQPSLIAGTLILLLLCVLALWHQDFPMALRQTRRGA